MGTLIGASRRGIVGAALMTATLVSTSMVIIAAPQGSAGGLQSPHDLTSPPTVTASTWRPTTSPDPTGNINLGNKAVSCATSTFCVAVGYYYTGGSSGYPLIQQWNGSTWTTVTPNVTPQLNFDLNGVSCVSATFCEAVGFTQVSGSSPNLPLAMVWNGSSWSTQSVPLPAGQVGGRLNGVTCLSATWCLAVGNSTAVLDFRQPQAGSVVWNGSQWTSPTVAAR